MRKGPRFASTCASSVAIAASRASDLIEMKAQQEAMVFRHTAAKGLAELLM